MSRSQLSSGASGSQVTELQKLLNQNGYSLAEDGFFGAKTFNAVKDYQSKNGLGVDGIVGDKTWAALTGSSGSAKGFQYDDFSYGDYKESDIVKQAGDALNAHLSQKPGAYQSDRLGQMDDIIKQIQSRPDFSYDVNSDALYQQYKDQYIRQGKLAMADTMGQAAAMTGGYGNSYAQTVGQQTYQGYLQQLNDVVPELYQQALDKYYREGDEMYKQYSLLGDRESIDYDRYRDTVSDWNSNRDYLAGRYDSERGYDYTKYSDDRTLAYNKYDTDKKLSYEEYRAAIEDEQWQKTYNAMYGDETAVDDTTGGNPTGDNTGDNMGKDPGGNPYNNAGYSDDVVKKAQAFVGASADGKWGNNSAQAAKNKGYNSLADVVAAMGAPSNENYSDFSALDWTDYFALINTSEGIEAALEEFNRLKNAGKIPTDMIAAATIGVRGRTPGH